MSTTTTSPQITRQPSVAERHITRGRRIALMMLIVALLATTVLRAVVHRQHDKLAYSDRPRPQSRLQGLNSFALGLVLGGLRGPLVMFLWTSSEAQKTERNLEDFDTKIELIRMLQPEFDSVIIFQTWNKGYNIPVQVATLPNKYATILDAVRFAREANDQRPDNVNILVSLGDLYFNKLGNSAEKKYYLARMRDDSRWREQKTARAAGQRQLRHEPMLTPEGFIEPRLLEPRSYVVSKPNPQGIIYTGAQLQFLEKYNTPEAGGFPYGLSSLAVGYNYYRRAAVLQETTNRRHLYLTEAVVDSRAPIILKFWTDEEWDRARRAEAKLVGKPSPEDKFALEPVTARLAPADLTDKSQAAMDLIAEALYSYRRGTAVAKDSAAGHRQHMSSSERLNTDYTSHAEDADAASVFLAADRDYLEAVAKLAGFSTRFMSASSPPELLRAARAAYAHAIDQHYLQTLKYYIEDEVAAKAYPAASGVAGMNKVNVHRADPSLFPAIYDATRAVLLAENKGDAHGDDTREYMAYIERARERLAQIAGMLGEPQTRPAPTSAPRP